MNFRLAVYRSWSIGWDIFLALYSLGWICCFLRESGCILLLVCEKMCWCTKQLVIMPRWHSANLQLYFVKVKSIISKKNCQNTFSSCINAPINVNPVGGGECGQGVGIWQILKFFDQIRQGGKRKVNQKCQKRPHPWGKNLNKQYYNTI